MQQRNFSAKKEEKEAIDAALESEYSFDQNEMTYLQGGVLRLIEALYKNEPRKENILEYMD